MAAAAPGRSMKRILDDYFEMRMNGPKNGYNIRVVHPDQYDVFYILLEPISGVYAGHKYILELKTEYGSPDVMRYPIFPPLVKFLTPIWHTNVSSSGSICLDIFKDYTKWSPMNNFSTVMQSIILLLEEPNNSSPFNGGASVEYIACHKLYKENLKLLDHKPSVQESEKAFNVAFMSFKRKAADVMNQFTFKQYSRWFPWLDRDNPQFAVWNTEDQEERQMIKERMEQQSREQLKKDEAKVEAPKKKPWEKFQHKKEVS